MSFLISLDSDFNWHVGYFLILKNGARTKPFAIFLYVLLEVFSWIKVYYAKYRNIMDKALAHIVSQKKENYPHFSDEKITVNLSLPSDLLGAMNIHQTALPLKIKELMALELFRENVISTGKAAELLNISKMAFIDILKRYHIDYFSESQAELTHQISMVDALLTKETL